MGSPVTWFEINSANASKLHGFYSEVFGWKVNPIPDMGYALVDTGSENGIAGGIGEAQGPNQVVFYVEVGDLNAVLDRIEESGGCTVVPITEIPDMVTFAQFADPEGNVVGITKAQA
jgi:predicted enzyme related to lactoylglutathione lyase